MEYGVIKIVTLNYCNIIMFDNLTFLSNLSKQHLC